MRNLSYENVFCMQFHVHSNQSHFHKNGFALRFALKQRHKGTWKWPIAIKFLFYGYLKFLKVTTAIFCAIPKVVTNWFNPLCNSFATLYLGSLKSHASFTPLYTQIPQSLKCQIPCKKRWPKYKVLYIL